MPNTTPNIGLGLPFGYEDYDVRVTNSNSEKIDAAFEEQADALETLDEKVNNVQFQVDDFPPILSIINAQNLLTFGVKMRGNTVGKYWAKASYDATPSNVIVDSGDYNLTDNLTWYTFDTVQAQSNLINFFISKTADADKKSCILTLETPREQLQDIDYVINLPTTDGVYKLQISNGHALWVAE